MKMYGRRSSMTSHIVSRYSQTDNNKSWVVTLETKLHSHQRLLMQKMNMLSQSLNYNCHHSMSLLAVQRMLMGWEDAIVTIPTGGQSSAL